MLNGLKRSGASIRCAQWLTVSSAQCLNGSAGSTTQRLRLKGFKAQCLKGSKARGFNGSGSQGLKGARAHGFKVQGLLKEGARPEGLKAPRPQGLKALAGVFVKVGWIDDND